MTKQVKEYLKANLPYYGAIGPSKGRYTGVKDKAWTILSDYVRCRDFYLFGTCVSSGKRFEHWRDGDAGHYVSMGGHGAYLGFYHLNIHLQGKNENQLGSMDSGAKFSETLKTRYGKKLLVELEEGKNKSVKADDWYFIQIIEDTNKRFQALKKGFPFADIPSYIRLPVANLQKGMPANL